MKKLMLLSWDREFDVPDEDEDEDDDDDYEYEYVDPYEGWDNDDEDDFDLDPLGEDETDSDGGYGDDA